MESVNTPDGTIVSYEVLGSGPALVLVHGSFSDHRTNWEFVGPALGAKFTVCAVARRGRGETNATTGHGVEDEGSDVRAVIEHIGQPAFVAGHSYGAHCALFAAHLPTGRVRKLVLYEPPLPAVIIPDATLARLETLARSGEWDELAVTFFRDALRVPAGDLDALRATDLWPPILSDARASLGDLRALHRYRFDAGRFRQLRVPVLLQVGSESPRDLYATDALAGVLPDVRVEDLAGQAHEAMTTAPELYVRSLIRFLLDEETSAPAG